MGKKLKVMNKSHSPIQAPSKREKECKHKWIKKFYIPSHTGGSEGDVYQCEKCKEIILA